MRNRESEGYTDSAVEDSARAPLLSRRRVRKTFPLESPSWIAVLTERALGTRSSAALCQQRRGSRVPEAQRAGRGAKHGAHSPAQGSSIKTPHFLPIRTGLGGPLTRNRAELIYKKFAGGPRFMHRRESVVLLYSHAFV